MLLNVLVNMLDAIEILDGEIGNFCCLKKPISLKLKVFPGLQYMLIV